MPFGVKPVCKSCKITSSPIWRKGIQGEVLCNSCGLKQQNNGHSVGSTAVVAVKVEPGGTGKTNGGVKSSSTAVAVSGSVAGSTNGAPVLRKSARIKPAKKSAFSSNKNLSTKGKGRRILFKKNQPLKAPAPVATVVTGESVFHKDQYFQAGDVVSLVDHDGGVYYAQIRGFLSDQYNDKSAVITWLLPTVHSPAQKFDPNTYILGPEEDLPRKMDYMEFVCHAPSDYFRARDAPYKTVSPEPKLCYIWTSIGPQIQTAPSIDEIFGISDNVSIGGASGQEKVDRDRNKDNPGMREKKTNQKDRSKIRMLKRKYNIINNNNNKTVCSL